MNDFQKIKNSLQTILKYGDIYDVVALKNHRNFPKHYYIKYSILLFSRILYFGVFLEEKIKSFFAPIEEVKKAQDQIRQILNIPVDIIRFKNKPVIFTSFLTKKKSNSKNELYLYYENEGLSMDAYIENLKKIEEFSEKYKINSILLKKEDINLVESRLTEFAFTNLKQILKINDYERSKGESKKVYPVEKKLEEPLLQLDTCDLYLLIQLLKSAKIDKKTVLGFKKIIRDIPVNNAIKSFLKDSDLEKLKMIVQNRLLLAINSNNSYKDKTHGKITENIQIKGEFIHVIAIDSQGIIINNAFMSLYEYFEVKDFPHLLKAIEIQKENKETLVLAAFYLYINEKIKPQMTLEENKKYISFYDYIYQASQAKRARKIKKIPGLYSKKQKIQDKILAFYNVFLVTSYLYFLLKYANQTVELIRLNYFENKNPTPIENTIDGIFRLYKNSFEFEYSLLEFTPIITMIKNLSLNFNAPKIGNEDSILNFNNQTGDTENFKKEILATITPLAEDVTLPTYYAKTCGLGGEYYNGKKTYAMKHDTISSISLYDVQPLFSITYSLTPEYIEEAIFYHKMDFLKTIYPLENNYVLTEVKILDRKDSSKIFLWNKEREANGNFLTEEERELLKSLKEPEISYTYGIKKDVENAFVSSMHKLYSYTDFSCEEIKSAIVKGLNLDENATLEDIFKVIKNKQYSTTPIADAKLTNQIKNMNELEYFETIASLDSLVCNLAATLAVGADEELIYTIGYLNKNDNYISSNEAHAWAMNKEGKIIDLTPIDTSLDMQDFISKALEWGLEHHLPLYAIALLIILIVEEKYGKKIILQLKIEKAKKILKNPDINRSYSNINKYLYGGINYSCQKDACEIVDSIHKEFSAITKEELTELKSDLKKQKNNIPKNTLDLMEEIPFVAENTDILKRSLTKK